MYRTFTYIMTCMSAMKSKNRYNQFQLMNCMHFIPFHLCHMCFFSTANVMNKLRLFYLVMVWNGKETWFFFVSVWRIIIKKHLVSGINRYLFIAYTLYHNYSYSRCVFKMDTFWLVVKYKISFVLKKS